MRKLTGLGSRVLATWRRHAPEPTTLLLFGSGFAAGVFLRRRRRGSDPAPRR